MSRARVLAWLPAVLLPACSSAPGPAEQVVVPKGRVPSLVVESASGFPDCSVEDCGALAPLQFAAVDAADPERLLFRRPDTTRTYYLVVDDDSPRHFTEAPADAAVAGGVLGAAAAMIVAASPVDCLEQGLFQVLRRAAYDALPLETRRSNYALRIRTGGFFEVCSGVAVACANRPRLGSVEIAGAEQQRLRFGDRIAFVDTGLVEPTSALVELSAYSTGVAVHELLHVMGMAHTAAGTPGDLLVPGTASGTSHPSILHTSSTNPNHRNGLQEDDVLTLETLYGGDCAYSDEPRAIGSEPPDAGAVDAGARAADGGVADGGAPRLP